MNVLYRDAALGCTSAMIDVLDEEEVVIDVRPGSGGRGAGSELTTPRALTPRRPGKRERERKNSDTVKGI